MLLGKAPHLTEGPAFESLTLPAGPRSTFPALPFPRGNRRLHRLRTTPFRQAAEGDRPARHLHSGDAAFRPENGYLATVFLSALCGSARFAADSLQEQAGFEPLVPHEMDATIDGRYWSSR